MSATARQPAVWVWGWALRCGVLAAVLVRTSIGVEILTAPGRRRTYVDRIVERPCRVSRGPRPAHAGRAGPAVTETVNHVLLKKPVCWVKGLRGRPTTFGEFRCRITRQCPAPCQLTLPAASAHQTSTTLNGPGPLPKSLRDDAIRRPFGRRFGRRCPPLAPHDAHARPDHVVQPAGQGVLRDA